MIVRRLKWVEVKTDRDLSRVRRAVASHAEEMNLGLLSRTRLVTAASELSRNMLTYGGGGEVRIDELRDAERVGLRATFLDHGPGIADLEEAFSDGFSSGKGLGLGLGGARRLVEDFRLVTEAGKGTTISIANWQGEGERRPCFIQS